jgi:secreted PhoX family phosphatase
MSRVIAAAPSTCAEAADAGKVDEPLAGRELDGLEATRRDVVRGLAAAALAAGASQPALAAARPAHAKAAGRQPPFNFKEIAAGVDERHHVAEGYDADILIRWGDPIHANAPAFDFRKQSAESQRQQFGVNTDFIGYVPLRRRFGLLCVHHEYSDPRMMFPGIGAESGSRTTVQQVATEMAAVGGSVVAVQRNLRGKWSVVRSSRFNRRITALDTAMTIDGPAAGHPRMRTKADPGGTRVVGTLAGCCGGITPWNTWLMSEENFHLYFSTNQSDESGRPKAGLGGDQARSWQRYGIPEGRAGWGRHVARFDVDKEPNEPNRFGWVIEVDPLDPKSTPVKHTALGRFRREGCENALAKDGRLVVYSGDDDRNEFVYKFVTRGRVGFFRRRNMRLLSEGTLFVARFNADFSGEWLPLIHGQGPLTIANGFASQADILIDTRLAASAVGATPMDRPEDIEPGPGGRVVIACTNNAERPAGAANAANPRAPNLHGHLIELLEAGGDNAATRFRWSFLALCGDHRNPAHGATWHPETSANGWFSCPDNLAFDPSGRLWVSTDQGNNWVKLTGRADGLYAVEHMGDKRGRSRLFFRCPVGAEMTGPRFTPDGETLFLSVQHPGADGARDWPKFARQSTADDPATRWPDFRDNRPPRASIVAVTRKNGGKIAV